MEIYLYIVAAVLIFGAIMPQKGPNRKYYIFLMTVIHTCVCGLRYRFLTGDLIKYYFSFLNSGTYGWFSEELLAEGRNSGFFIVNKIINILSGGEFQVFLFFIALVTHLVLGYVIFRYSPMPWMSYLVWNCMALYIFGFNAIKQALAMAFVMLAFIGIAEKRPIVFLLWMAVAGSIHVPALIFLPAYILAQMRVDGKMLCLYLLLGVAIYVYKEQFVAFIRSFYYEDDEIFVFAGELGGRFMMVLGFTIFGLLFRGFSDRTYESLFHIMAIAAILQMLSGFDNIFTRLTDYYFQFSVLYIPMIFFPGDQQHQRVILRPLLPFNDRSLKVLAGLLCVFMLWFYWTYNINITISYQVDNYLNFRFMWDVTK